ncbi:MAG: methylamine utilization protein [Pseudomonadota bacterium]
MSRLAKSVWIRRASAAGFASLALCCAAQAGSLSASVRQRDGKPLVGAVITLEAQTQTLPAATPVAAIMDQMNLAFVPDVLVIPVHSTVQFPNSDPISHQVYSFSTARKFQLPLYRGRAYPPVMFDQPGVITLGCNIHDNMLAYILVTAAPYFGRTDAAGEWVVTSLPSGKYRLRVWHPLINEPQEVERDIQAGTERESVDLRLTRPLRPAPLTGRPHSWEY